MVQYVEEVRHRLIAVDGVPHRALEVVPTGQEHRVRQPGTVVLHRRVNPGVEKGVRGGDKEGVMGRTDRGSWEGRREVKGGVKTKMVSVLRPVDKVAFSRGQNKRDQDRIRRFDG